jgi:hypothetical protein
VGELLGNLLILLLMIDGSNIFFQPTAFRFKFGNSKNVLIIGFGAKIFGFVD